MASKSSVVTVTEPEGPREAFTVSFPCGITLSATRVKKRGAWKVTSNVSMLGDREVFRAGAGTDWAVVGYTVKCLKELEVYTPGKTLRVNLLNGVISDWTTGKILA